MAAIAFAGLEREAGRNAGALPDAILPDAIRGGLLPSLVLHGALATALWLAVSGSRGQPPQTVTALSLVAPMQSVAVDVPAPMLPEVPYIAPSSPPRPQALPYEPFLNPPLPKAAPSVTAPEPEHAVPLEPRPPIPPKQTADDKPQQKSQSKPKPKAAQPAKLKPATTAVMPKPAAPQSAPAPAVAPSPHNVTAAAPASATAIDDTPVRVTRPDFAGACPIRYPERARRRNQEGTVVIHALIDTAGKPIDVDVAASSGHRLLDEAALAAIAGCAFVPQRVGGRPVRAIVEIPIPFKLI